MNHYIAVENRLMKIRGTIQVDSICNLTNVVYLFGAMHQIL